MNPHEPRSCKAQFWLVKVYIEDTLVVLRTIEAGADLQFRGRCPTGDTTHKPNSRLPLVSGRPAVTLPASDRHCLWSVAIYLTRCVNNLPWVTAWPGIERMSSRSLVLCPACCSTTPHRQTDRHPFIGLFSRTVWQAGTIRLNPSRF